MEFFLYLCHQLRTIIKTKVMLIHSMTENEIRNEIAKDTPNIAIHIKDYLNKFIKSKTRC